MRGTATSLVFICRIRDWDDGNKKWHLHCALEIVSGGSVIICGVESCKGSLSSLQLTPPHRHHGPLGTGLSPLPAPHLAFPRLLPFPYYSQLGLLSLRGTSSRRLCAEGFTYSPSVPQITRLFLPASWKPSRKLVQRAETPPTTFKASHISAGRREQREERPA